jgi:hypothetical protein
LNAKDPDNADAGTDAMSSIEPSLRSTTPLLDMVTGGKPGPMTVSERLIDAVLCCCVVIAAAITASSGDA